MRVNSSSAVGWYLTALLFLVLVVNVMAKDRDPTTIVQGTVFLIAKDMSIIMVDTTTGTRRVVVYNANTKFSYGRRNKARQSAISQVQENQYISCRGTSDDGARLLAKECVHRERK